MKIKKILSLALAVAMIMAVVPSFGIVASAATKGDEVTVDGKPYMLVDGVNYITNPDFALNNDGKTISGWTSSAAIGTNITTGTYYTRTEEADGNYITIVSGKPWYCYSPTESGGTDRRQSSITTYWDGAKAGKLYYVSFDIKATKEGNKQNYAYFNVYSTKSNNSYTDVKNFADRNDSNLKSGAIAEPYATKGKIGTWETVSTLFDVKTDGYFAFQYNWATDWETISLRNFKIYEVEKIPTTVTVNFVDGDGNSVAEAKSITEGIYAGDSYAYDTASDMVKTKDGKTYVLDTVNTYTHIAFLEASNNVITVYYVEDTPKSVEDINITTRVNVSPALPETVDAIGTTGATIAGLPVTWEENTVPTEVGTYVINGYLTSFTNVTFKANITVEDKEDYLVAHYTFDEDGTNAVSENYTAQIGEEVNYVRGVNGSAISLPGGATGFVESKAVKLDGNLFADEAFKETKSFTISAYVNKQEDGQDWARLYDFGVGRGGDLFYAINNYNSDWDLFKLQDLGTDSETGNATITAKEWCHVATTLEYVNDNTWNAVVYHDGIESSRTTFKDDFTRLADLENVSYYLGASHWDDNLFTGYIDDFKVYSVALTVDEVADLANIGKRDITVQYTFDDKVIDEITAKKTGRLEWETASFEAKTYAPDGGNYIYTADAVTTDKDVTVPMTRLDNPDVNGYELGGTITSDGKEYTIKSGNLVPNGDFSNGLVGWYNGAGGQMTKMTVNGDGTAKLTGSGGSGSDAALQRGWSIESGKTYLFTYTQDNEKDDATWQRTSLSDVLNNGTVLIGDGGTVKNKPDIGTNTLVFKNESNKYLNFRAGYSENVTFGNFGLYEVEENVDKSATVTVSYTVNGETVKTETKTVLKGETASFDAVSIVNNNKFYSAAAVSYTNVQEDKTYEVVLTETPNTAAAFTSFAWNFKANERQTVGGDHDTAKNDSNLLTIGWGDPRGGVIAFDIKPEEGKVFNNAVLKVNVPYYWGDPTLYAVSPEYLGSDNYSLTYDGSALAKEDAPNTTPQIVSDMGGYAIGSIAGNGVQSVELDLKNYFSKFPNADKVVVISLSTSGQTYVYGNDYAAFGENVPTLTYECVEAQKATIKYVTTDGTQLQNDSTLNYFEGEQYGYNKDAIFPQVEIPYFEGYVFKNKTVNGTTVTLNYEATQAGNFFNNVANDTTLVSLNMLGAHDAFTAGIDSKNVKKDAGATAQGDSGAQAVTQYGTGASLSRAQSADALTLLNAGVRYFDIRLSRSDKNAVYKPTLSLTSYTAPHTNGVFYTTHGMLSDEFRPIAYTIGQWVKEHPGEIVVLDFQEAYDYTGSKEKGDGDADTWRAINAILEEAGINSYVSHANGNARIKDLTYGQLTNNGEKAGIVLWGRAVGTNAGVGKFMLRHVGIDGTSGLFNGHLYSNYEPTNGTTIGTSFSEKYIEAQIADMKVYANEDGSGDHPVVWMQRVMQAQSQSKANLITQASSDNSSLYTALTKHPEWLTALPIVMVDDAVTNTSNILALLKSSNEAQNITVNYQENGTTVATKTKTAMIGTLYTDEASDAFIRGVDGGNYLVTDVPVTAPSNSALITPVPYNGSISVNVARKTIYGISYGYTSDTVGKLYSSDDSIFTAFFWGGDTYEYRVGVAELAVSDANADADADAYVLNAKRSRWYSTGGATMKFYAVKWSDYVAADFSTSEGYNALISEENVVYTESKNVDNDDKTLTDITILLDKDVMKSKIEDGKVVIFGVATGGLYGLSDEGMEIVGKYNQNITVNYVCGEETVASEVAEVFVGEDTYTVAKGVYYKNYYLAADTTVAIVDGVAIVELNKFGKVFTVNNEGYVGSDFDLTNWSTEHVQAAFATVDVTTTGALSYILKGTVKNNQSNENVRVSMDIYAISPSELAAMDKSSIANIEEALKDKTPAYELVEENNKVSKRFGNEELNASIIEAAVEDEQVVLVALGTRMSYNISGEDIYLEANKPEPTTENVKFSVALIEGADTGKVVIIVDGEELVVTKDEDGNLTVELEPGEHTITIRRPGYLARTFVGLDAAGIAALGDIELVAGNVNGDTKVDLKDLNLLLDIFGGVNIESDFNDDGKVDLKDLNQLLDNFGAEV